MNQYRPPLGGDSAACTRAGCPRSATCARFREHLWRLRYSTRPTAYGQFTPGEDCPYYIEIDKLD